MQSKVGECLDFIRAKGLDPYELTGLSHEVDEIARKTLVKHWVEYLKRHYDFQGEFELFNMIYKVAMHYTPDKWITFELDNDDILFIGFGGDEHIFLSNENSGSWMRIYRDGRVESHGDIGVESEIDLKTLSSAMYHLQFPRDVA